MSYTMRQTTLTDLNTIAEHRYLMFAEMGMDVDMLAEARAVYIPWLQEVLSDGNYIGVFAQSEGEIIAGAGMWVTTGAPLPTLHSPDLRRANIVNVYTHPDHRRRGLARQLVNHLLDIARDKGIPVVQLHASDAGRALYESIGFRDTNELRLFL